MRWIVHPDQSRQVTKSLKTDPRHLSVHLHLSRIHIKIRYRYHSTPLFIDMYGVLERDVASTNMQKRDGTQKMSSRICTKSAATNKGL